MIYRYDLLRLTVNHFSQKVLRVRGRSWAGCLQKRIVRVLGYAGSHEKAPVRFQTQGNIAFFAIVQKVISRARAVRLGRNFYQRCRIWCGVGWLSVHIIGVRGL